MSRFIIEIASSDFATTQAAVAGGADRIELCANLAEGGTTASYGHIRQCREAFTEVQLYPIIRHRGGDFLYTEEEFRIMLLDVQLCKELGCDGVVVGMLMPDGTVDKVHTASLVEAAYPLGVTFHRAFDRCRDPFEALETLVGIGCERILTSGQKPMAPDAVALIAALNKAADDRIIIMPGSGVRKENIRQLAEQTGCTEFHSSLRSKVPTAMNFIHPAFADDAETAWNNAVLEADVRAFREALLS